MNTAVQDLDAILKYLHDIHIHNNEPEYAFGKESDLPYSDSELRELVKFLKSKGLVDAEFAKSDVYFKITIDGIRFIRNGGYTAMEQAEQKRQEDEHHQKQDQKIVTHATVRQAEAAEKANTIATWAFITSLLALGVAVAAYFKQ